MSGSTTISCPTGLVVTLREFKVTDENLLSNKKSVRNGVGITNLLAHVTMSVDDVGPYTLSEPDRHHDRPWLDWMQVLQGDRLVILKENRVVTWGPDMTDKRPCQNCREPVSTHFSLKDLPVQALPESSMAHVTNPVENPIKTTLPKCGVTVGFRLLRGKDEKVLQKIAKQSKDKLSSAYLRLRVVAIEGVSEPEWNAWLEDLGGYDSAYLRAAFDKADCGLEQSWGFECDECGHLWDEDVKLREDFLFPTYRGKITTS